MPAVVHLHTEEVVSRRAVLLFTIFAPTARAATVAVRVRIGVAALLSQLRHHRLALVEPARRLA